jgi:iron complex transport system ATP-binding protein
LVSEAEILILDKPTSALDLRNQILVLEWITRLSPQDGLTIVFTTHHPHHALAVSDNALLVLGGAKCVCGPASAVLNEENLHAL